MLFSFSVSLEAKESMKKPDFNFHGVFCFIKYICLGCEKLAVTSKNSGIFGLTNRVASKSITTTRLYQRKFCNFEDPLQP